MLVKQFKMKLKNKTEDFIVFLCICTLGASLLGNILAGNCMNGTEEGFLKAGHGSSIKSRHF